MRILHLSSDWKWTGPAEPMLQLARAQCVSGHRVELACAEAPRAAAHGLARRAREAGLAPALALEPRRGANPLRDGRDLAALRAHIAQGVDVLHAWHTRDHVLAWRAVAAAAGNARPRVIRSLASADPVPAWPWNRWLFGRATDGLACVSEASARAIAPLRGGRATAAVAGAVDLTRFSPLARAAPVRAALGLAPEHAVIGVVARVQRHRRFDLLLEAFARLSARDPSARLLVVGRGTHLDAVARRPARDLGIADRVVLAGYRDIDYADVLRTIDVFTFLVPGSDGTCRALLEAQACGIPAVASRRGALPEIVADSETGILVPESSEALAGAWETLLRDPARRARYGRAARERAERLFAPARQLRAVEALYEAAGVACSSTSSR